jgi:hypothetical protein
MERCERSRRGVACVTVGVIIEWRIVGIRMAGGHIYDVRVLSWAVSDRFGVEVGVRISLPYY